MTPSDFHLRAMKNNDVEELTIMTDEVGWGFTEESWRVMIASGLGFVLEAPNGDLAASSLVFRYHQRLAFLGMIIVREQYRGLRLATKIMDAAEGAVDQNSMPLGLIATTDGEPVYRARGYRTVTDCVTLSRPSDAGSTSAPALDDIRYQPLGSENFEAVCTLDKEACQLDRTTILAAMTTAGFKGITAWDRNENKLLGYVFLSPKKSKTVIGPVVAKERSVALALCQMLIYGREEEFSMNILSHQPEFLLDLENLGFQIQKTSSLMMHGKGRNRLLKPGTFALISQAFG